MSHGPERSSDELKGAWGCLGLLIGLGMVCITALAIAYMVTS